ncbi:TetR/AcrR family transcriptional regulator [Leekyejoonella antrihumi]|uniref:TetR/AcrR family transcriptional regulator n=1 Tax=Leekyejoonella antrihumi TaxID=1660198 RepID=A0A563DVI3_9MICO|nr:TetR/AcrR family transcriptional regulator [Leekyejoonella antrihumi]TWP33952.1 TetR/AcrR family transcriptional regulator [Leekyejoonella antrihumi]
MNQTTVDARAPKQDRSRATRQRLIEAAITCLARDGWSRSTVSVIAAEAGISRGATQHHFPTREDLILAALERMFELRIAQVDVGEVQGRPEGRARTVVLRLVEYYTGDLFKAALQVWTAAAADETLRERIVPLERKFAREVHAAAVRLLGADDSDPATHRMIQATLDMARGFGLADVLSDDSRRRRHVAEAWADQLAGVIAQAGEARSAEG